MGNAPYFAAKLVSLRKQTMFATGGMLTAQLARFSLHFVRLY